MHSINAEFDVAYSPNGVYDLMYRMDLSCQMPRPRHRKPTAHSTTSGAERLLIGFRLYSYGWGSNTGARKKVHLPDVAPCRLVPKRADQHLVAINSDGTTK